MRKAIISLVFGVIFATTVYAVPPTAGGPVITESEVGTPPTLTHDSTMATATVPTGALGTKANNAAVETVSTLAASEPINQESAILFPEPKEKEKKVFNPQDYGSKDKQETSPRENLGAAENVSREAFGTTETAKETAESVVKVLLDRLGVLEGQNSKLKEEITQLTSRVSLLEERVIGHVGEQQASTATKGKVSIINGLKKVTESPLYTFVIYVLGGILVLFFGYLFFPKRKKLQPANYPKDDLLTQDKDQDFNPLAGEDGIAAKLNLARAYIDMGKESLAQAMLSDVMTHGNDSEKAEAKSLLDKLTPV